jgi:hypothetical protein
MFLGAALAWLAPATAAMAQEEEGEPTYGDERVWIEAGGGYQAIDLVAFEEWQAPLERDLLPTQIGGPVLSVGGGVRLWRVHLGPRVRVAFFDAEQGGTTKHFDMWNINMEAGLRFPIGRVEPRVSLAGGYVALSGLGELGGDPDGGIDVQGGNLRAGGGVGFYITENVSLDADVSGDLLFLDRSRSIPDQVLGANGEPAAQRRRTRSDEGTAIGGAVTVIGGVGFHF